MHARPSLDLWKWSDDWRILIPLNARQHIIENGVLIDRFTTATAITKGISFHHLYILPSLEHLQKLLENLSIQTIIICTSAVNKLYKFAPTVSLWQWVLTSTSRFPYLYCHHYEALAVPHQFCLWILKHVKLLATHFNKYFLVHLQETRKMSKWFFTNICATQCRML